MRPIDADALRAKMYHDAFETDSDMQKWESGCWIRYKLFEKNLEDAPTIAQPERKKGTWGADGECPFCGYLRQWEDDNFCANCGADMRGGNND